VDISAPKGTAIHAAAAGVVSVVRCNAVYAATGADYGCDRDGDPVLTRGCGWYVDITHAGNLITRYCHQLTRPAVSEGQQVTAGQVIGVVGSSGNSSGPHLHYEVHLGDHTSTTATDPIAFMTAVGAPLGLPAQPGPRHHVGHARTAPATPEDEASGNPARRPAPTRSDPT
jgi:murein DD-endopeptidase MepM/ murein hydrolase activator NlpD